MPKISELVEKTGLIGSEFVAIQDANVTKKASLASIGAILGGGGATVTVSDTAPVAENEGDLWYTPTDGALYVYITGSLNAWVQTNGGGGGGGASVTVSDTAPADAGEGDLWFDDVNATLYVYLAGSTNAWIQISGGGQSGGGGEGYGVTAMVHASNIRSNVTASNANAGTGTTWGNYDRLYDLNDITASNTTWGNGGTGEVFRQGTFDPNGGPILVQVSYSRHNENTSGGAIDQCMSWVKQYHDVDNDSTRVVIHSSNSPGDSSGVVAAFLNLTAVQLGTTQGAGGSGGGASVTASDTAPTAPGDGDLWFDTSVMELYVYVAAESSWIQTNGGGGSGGSFSTGWVNQDKNGVAVNVNTRLEFDHNLGTTDFVVKVYQANDANGTDAREVSDYYYNVNNEYGSRVHDITSTSLAIEFGAGGDYNLNLAAVGNDTTSSLAGNWIKVVCVAGGGSGGAGPRAYVVFDGRSGDLTGSITSSSNVTGITDSGVGQYTIDLSTTITNPLLVTSPIGEYRSAYADITWRETHSIALPYNTTTGLGATSTSQIWVECSQPQTGGNQDSPVHLLVF